MIESPLLKEIVDEARQEGWQKSILQILADRFGPVPQDIEDAVRTTTDETRLGSLSRLAARCTSIEEFRVTIREQPVAG